MAESLAKWIMDKRVLLNVLSGNYEPNSLRQCAAALKDDLERGSAPVHLILDMTRLSHLPADLREPLHQMSPLANAAMLMGWTFGLTQQPTTRLFSLQVARLMGSTLVPVDTLTEALDILKRVDPQVQQHLDGQTV